MTEAAGPDSDQRLIGSPSAEIVLASASMTRRRLLEGAGVPHIVAPSRVDEDEIKIGLRAEGATGAEIAASIGKSLARLETRIALEEIGSRFPDYEVDEGGITRTYQAHVRGFATVPLAI